jgi:hypothetical protein
MGREQDSKHCDSLRAQTKNPELEDMVTKMETKLRTFRDLTLDNPTAKDLHRLQAAEQAVSESLQSIKKRSEFQGQVAESLFRKIQLDVSDV